ncbi:hypothetical protein N9Y01_00130 [Candidatus Poseidonia alphae]|nr:hypothetical protein [Candidatus Poseidonia alphae]
MLPDWANLQNRTAGGFTMARDRTLKKVNKLLQRVEKHIEATRDALEDLEIEFDVLKAAVKRLKSDDAPVDEVPEPEMDLENASNTSSIQKF